MYSKIAFACSTRVLRRFRFSNPACMRPRHDPATALSYRSATVPSQGGRPASLALEASVQDVNWVPWSPWMIDPGEGPRESMAIFSAFVVGSARWALPVAS
jgi:hypothetical protein